MRKIKVAIVTPEQGDACSIYRAVGPYSKLEGIDLQVYDASKGFLLWQAVLQNEVILLHRPWLPIHVSIAETIKACQKKLIVDWDDDLTAVPAWNPNRKHFEQCQSQIRRLCELADAVTVTTPALAEKVVELGAKNVRMIRNALDDTFKALPKLPRKKVVAWRGSGTHSADLDLCRKPLRELHAKGYGVHFFGDCPPYAWEFADYKHTPVADYVAYITALNAAAPTYVLAKLVDCQFNRCKSDIVAHEAWAVGAKLIHNSIGVFDNLPEYGDVRWLSDENPLRLALLKDLVD